MSHLAGLQGPSGAPPHPPPVQPTPEANALPCPLPCPLTAAPCRPNPPLLCRLPPGRPPPDAHPHPGVPELKSPPRSHPHLSPAPVLALCWTAESHFPRTLLPHTGPGHPHDRLRDAAWACPLLAEPFCGQHWPVRLCEGWAAVPSAQGWAAPQGYFSLNAHFLSCCS